MNPRPTCSSIWKTDEDYVPCLRKKNEGTADCTRCGCELSILESILLAEAHKIHMGTKSIKTGDPLEALRHAEESWTLRKSAAAARLAFLASLAAGDLEGADLWYMRATREHEGEE